MTTARTARRGSEGLTSPSYWEGVWRQKDGPSWDRTWVDQNYAWFALDQLLRRSLTAGAGARLLEVGCASGKWLIYFHRTFGYSVTGCDYSATGCEIAQQSLDTAGVPGTVLNQDLFTLADTWDVVFSAGLIEHFDRPETVLAKFATLLQPKTGTLVTLVPNLGGLSGLYHRCLKPETFETHRPITPKELAAWHRDLGFRQVAVGAFGSIVPARFPRDKLRQGHPGLHRMLWPLLLRPATAVTNRLCIMAFRRFGLQVESPSFSPYLFAIARDPGGGAR
jgi:2-polyprenyl-3-methyl-5-hydroxy-6-metoxy-1,4-benzoquinol methylase